MPELTNYKFVDPEDNMAHPFRLRVGNRAANFTNPVNRQDAFAIAQEAYEMGRREMQYELRKLLGLEK